MNLNLIKWIDQRKHWWRVFVLIFAVSVSVVGYIGYKTYNDTAFRSSLFAQMFCRLKLIRAMCPCAAKGPLVPLFSANFADSYRAEHVVVTQGELDQRQ